jgi:hypothetical protein
MSGHLPENNHGKENIVEPLKHQDHSEKWFYKLEGERKGPVDEQAITDLIKSGVLGYGSRVWNRDLHDSRPLEETRFRDLISAPPPLTGTAVNITMVWWLAFVPVIGYVLELKIADAAEISANSLWFITLALNIGFSALDEKKLQKARHDTSRMGSSWIVPVSLFKRSRILKRRMRRGEE